MQDAISAGFPIGKVWSGHPVSFDIITERGYQFVAYYDSERRITLVGRNLSEMEWTRVQPDGVPVPNEDRNSNITNWDSHNYLRMALDQDGCLHLCGNMHNHPMVYYRTSKPFDLSSLERIDFMTGDRETRCTYPVFFRNAPGDFLFRYRDGGSGNGSDIYNIYDPATKTWRHLLDTPLLDGQGLRNAYALDPILGPDGYFHLVWMWRDTPDCSTNNNLSYARSRDLLHWETSAGDPLPLPITLATGEVIDPAQNGEGLINMTFNLGFDSKNRPLVIYHRYDAQKISQAYAARPNANSAWDVQQISDWNFCWGFSGWGSIAAEVTLGPPRLDTDGSLLVDFSTQNDGAGRWRLSGEKLERIAQLPPAALALPEELMQPQSSYPGMEVQTTVSCSAGRRWVLRWETLPRNRDLPQEQIPPPTDLQIYETPDTDTASNMRVGS